MKQTLILILVVLLLGGAGYAWYAYIQSAPTTDQTPSTVNPQVALKQQIANLRRLKDLHLDTSLFQDPFFQQLKANDGSVLAPAETTQQQGRPNPFLPF